MFEKNYKVSYLLDFYGNILTEKQKDAIDLYYNEDLSLAEIAEHVGITRQGVRDAIKRGEEILVEMEEKLGFAEKFGEYKKAFETIGKCVENIRTARSTLSFMKIYEDNVNKIADTVKSVDRE
ncbi:MAG: YlxM family DNA-binding protein [Oscillospiraceae bacterium]|nr:YlxM family DNA-binding protein [Oscillospiraceae bacterium]